MQKELINPFDGHVTRTREECKQSFRLNVSRSGHYYIEAGYDLLELRAQSQHGEWLNDLKDLGLSASAAENHMRIAREITPDSPLASLPYSKALALLRLPADQREDFAEEHSDKSSREIARLIQEKMSLQKEVDQRAKDAAYWQQSYQDEHGYTVQLRKDLSDERAKPAQIVEKTVEVAPADYEELREKADGLEEAVRAAVDAEERARALEDELAALKREKADDDRDETVCGSSEFADAVYAFLCRVQALPHHPEHFEDPADRHSMSFSLMQVESFIRTMRARLDQADHVPGEVVVV